MIRLFKSILKNQTIVIDASENSVSGMIGPKRTLGEYVQVSEGQWEATCKLADISHTSEVVAVAVLADGLNA